MGNLLSGFRAAAPRPPGAAVKRVDELIRTDRCVVLDGATGTELGRRLAGIARDSGEAPWSVSPLIHEPGVVHAVHLQYVEAGCDVISTNTWGLTSAVESGARAAQAPPLHWMDVARSGIRVARGAVEEAGRTGEVAVAFSINGDVESEARADFFELLPRVFADEPPDLILFETVTLIREPLTFRAVEALVATGIPVWTSFRRCRHGVCGVYGEHWGGPEGDAFGRAARRLEALGVRALLVNCLPPDHLPGMLPWLRDFVDLPLGVYPNLGYYTSDGWSFDKSVGGSEYAELAATWRDEGAQIIGGCCGVRPDHIAAAAERVRQLRPGWRSEAGTATESHHPLPRSEPQAPVAPWVDARGKQLFPLELPEIVCDPDVFVPTQGSFLVWKHLFQQGTGDGKRCLDVGCGSGLLSIQLAANGAEHVHAIDVDRRAVANTLSNAFRNDVADRISGEVVDLYPWVPREAYEVVVASLYQMPVHPYEQANGHRPLDFWGRSLIDHLFSLLPSLLEPDGRAYVMQLSILGQQRTAELLTRLDLSARVVDFAFFNFHALFQERRTHIERVEELSDAYHLRFRDEDVMVAYLIEITRSGRSLEN